MLHPEVNEAVRLSTWKPGFGERRNAWRPSSPRTGREARTPFW